jgi:hypothetical protein
MRLIYYALLMALTVMPVSVMAADAPSNEEISKRLKALDSRIDRLERREKAEMKSAAKKADGKAAAAKGKGKGKGPSAAEWKKVYSGMSQDEVKKILGEPRRMRTTAKHDIWSWYPTSVTGGEIWFADRAVDRIVPPME